MRMKITLPTRQEVGAWLTGATVICAGILAGKRDASYIGPAFVAWLIFCAAALLYLTVRANIRAALAARKRGDIAGQ